MAHEAPSKEKHTVSQPFRHIYGFPRQNLCPALGWGAFALMDTGLGDNRGMLSNDAHGWQNNAAKRRSVTMRLQRRYPCRPEALRETECKLPSSGEGLHSTVPFLLRFFSFISIRIYSEDQT